MGIQVLQVTVTLLAEARDKQNVQKMLEIYIKKITKENKKLVESIKQEKHYTQPFHTNSISLNYILSLFALLAVQSFK